MAFPPRKFMIMGEAGVGKTSLLATFPQPILSFHFDNPDKAEEPYERLGDYERDPKTGLYLRPNPGILGPIVNSDEGRYRWVTSRRTNKKIILIRFYKDIDPRDPRGWVDFHNYHTKLVHGGLYRADGTLRWNTIGYDSVGGMEFLARKDQQYRMNADAKDSRQWYGGSTDELEEFLQSSVPALPCNAVVITHIDHREDPIHGGFLHMPVAPGRLRINLFRDYSEMYRFYVAKDEEGTHRRLQTAASGEFHAFTQIGAPDGCKPTYRSLWVNWAKTHKEEKNSGEFVEGQRVS